MLGSWVRAPSGSLRKKQLSKLDSCFSRLEYYGFSLKLYRINVNEIQKFKKVSELSTQSLHSDNVIDSKRTMLILTIKFLIFIVLCYLCESCHFTNHYNNLQFSYHTNIKHTNYERRAFF